ncbi:MULTISPECIES: DUF1439 domain-containing protein [Shewanella]|uniref:DUF1439 domain-containing protein n=1 Tax=Shewanella fidelis TaxID=173509 RepID=A0AAW8NU38_9GAMM|nr:MULTISPECIES: DUF1439 domain-containing protein [Shewanella]MDR8526071.1 DUF1439 domain-containing protein [Shewanella fidelis]MDW4813684.1 DUF1439 domain-containing protein [Shewanella fidelis]MDW4817780.1 DUF1439 domain-containing protein [Shewanella fidelis]MDW4821959.1 DUF1439 domain-containing protein [Shewanella fidelis]MDW4826012.1 DUF1439 domain-containing protein [Shewanella fidelis]
MKLLKVAFAGAALLLTGCVSQYSITEKELEGYLNDEMHFEVKQGNQIFGIDLRVNDIKVTLGDKPDTMGVSAVTLVRVRNPMLPINADLVTQFEAQPWYDATNHSVYLRNLQLVKVESKPKDIEKAIGSIAPQLMGFLTQFLETQPVYVVDMKESKQALVADMTKRIEVKPGKLVLVFDEE